MSRFKTIPLLFFLWATVAQAQVISAQGFGEDLNRISGSTWGWALVYCAVGTLARILGAVKDHEVELSTLGIISWVSIGLVASYIAFAGCEYAATILDKRINPLLEGAIIMVAAYFRMEILNMSLLWIKRILRMDTPAGG